MMEDNTPMAQLFRVTCPRPLELQLYFFHELEGHRQGEIAEHVGRCPHCAADYVALGVFMSEDSDESVETLPEWIRAAADRLVVSFAKLVPPVSVPAMALRGETVSTQLYETADLGLAVNVARDPVTGRSTLSGQVLSAHPNIALAGRVQVTPKSASSYVRETTLRATGSFELSDLASDAYSLVLVLPSRRIIIPNIFVGASPDSRD